MLLRKLPMPVHLDRLCDEWAVLNEESQRFARAVEIFRLQITETPESDLADNARYSLAESDLIAGKLEEAKAAFRQLEQSPKSDADVQQDSLLRLMSIAEEQKQWEARAKTAEAIRSLFAAGRYRSNAVLYLE